MKSQLIQAIAATALIMGSLSGTQAADAETDKYGVSRIEPKDLLEVFVKYLVEPLRACRLLTWFVGARD